MTVVMHILLWTQHAPFKSCLSRTASTFIDNAEDLGIVMPMYNLLEYSYNYSITSGRLWNCYRDEVNDDANGKNLLVIEPWTTRQ